MSKTKSVSTTKNVHHEPFVRMSKRDGLPIWQHVVCPDARVDALMAPARRGEVSCPVCWLIHTEGACDA